MKHRGILHTPTIGYNKIKKLFSDYSDEQISDSTFPNIVSLLLGVNDHDNDDSEDNASILRNSDSDESDIDDLHQLNVANHDISDSSDCDSNSKLSDVYLENSQGELWLSSAQRRLSLEDDEMSANITGTEAYGHEEDAGDDDLSDDGELLRAVSRDSQPPQLLSPLGRQEEDPDQETQTLTVVSPDILSPAWIATANRKPKAKDKVVCIILLTVFIHPPFDLTMM